MKTHCVKVRKEVAAGTIAFLLKNNYLERSMKVERDGNFVYFPVVQPVPGYEIVEMDCIPRGKFVPFKEIVKKLGIDENLVPRKWEKFGSVVVVKIPEKLKRLEEKIGRVFADVLHVRTVLADRRGISGEFRKPEFEVIYGTETVTVHKESGVLFKFDAMKLMFSSGNVLERGRLIGLIGGGETIVDMFAGIGYFTIPIAIKSQAEKIYACEKNPEAFEYLCENIRLNKVSGKVIPLLGDCREVAPENVADRVIMGYLKETHSFLPKARRCLKEGKGIIHYHDVARAEKFPDEMIERVREHLPAFEITGERVVKSYAPKMVHGVLDIKVM
ncbi:MAG: class I SAM-dependent methyltransferase [Thermoplasmata archaeon]